jgi:hypothetical protein
MKKIRSLVSLIAAPGIPPPQAVAQQTFDDFSLDMVPLNTDPEDSYFGVITCQVTQNIFTSNSAWRLEHSPDLGATWLPFGEGVQSMPIEVYRIPDFTWPPQPSLPSEIFDSRLIFLKVYQDASNIASWEASTGHVETRFVSSEFDMTQQNQLPLSYARVHLEATGNQS